MRFRDFRTPSPISNNPLFRPPSPCGGQVIGLFIHPSRGSGGEVVSKPGGCVCGGVDEVEVGQVMSC